MSDTGEARRREVLVSAQQALLGEVGPNLRAVIVSFSESTIFFESFFHGEISDEDRESMSLVETELLASFPSNHAVSHKLTRLDEPAPIPQRDHWAYLRRERPWSCCDRGVAHGQ
jgi:hypothetical protein